MWEFRQNCCPAQEASITIRSRLRSEWLWGGDAAGMQGDVGLRGTLLVPLPPAVSCWCPGTALDRAALCIPAALLTAGISHVFHNPLAYLLLRCTCVCCQPWTVKQAWIQLSETGQGYYPQTAGLGGKEAACFNLCCLGYLGIILASIKKI